MKRVYCFLLALCLMLSACASSAEPDPIPADLEPEATQPEVQEPATPEESPEPELTQREKDWREDLEHLKNEYKSGHMNPYYYCTEEELDWRFDQLEARVDDLTDNEIFFELSTIMARMGDVHTSIHWPASITGSVFPVSLVRFGNGVYLSAYQEGYEQYEPYLLREVVAVNGVDMSYLQKKYDSTHHPASSWGNRENFPRYRFYPAFLDWAGCGYTEGYTFQILNENQEVESVEIPAVPKEQVNKEAWVYPEVWDSLFYLKKGNWVDYVEDEAGSCVYMSFTELAYNSESLYRLFFEEAVKQFAEHPDCDKLVIDCRLLPGGYGDAVEAARKSLSLLKDPAITHTYILTSGITSSAGMVLLSTLLDELDAVTVGEPTGQFTSFFVPENAQLLTLPNSQLTAQICDSWVSGSDWCLSGTPAVEELYDADGKLYEWENTVLPDVYIHQDIDDIRQGKDSVIQWILAQ